MKGFQCTYPCRDPRTMCRACCERWVVQRWPLKSKPSAAFVKKAKLIAKRDRIAAAAFEKMCEEVANSDGDRAA